MNRVSVLLHFVTLLLFCSIVNAQNTKMIKGRVLDEELELLPGAEIYTLDTVVLGSTDLEGYFNIKVPAETNELLLGALGMEWVPLKVKKGCQNLEIIVMIDVIYDFISAKSERRKRHRRFKRLPKKHLEAYEQGLFKSEKPCVCYVFRE